LRFPSLTAIGSPTYSKSFTNLKSRLRIDLSGCPELKHLPDYALSGCTSSVDIILNDSLKTIGYGALFELTSLKKITLPNQLESIGDLAFRLCTSLVDVVLNKHLKNIGDSAFADNSSLKSITLPDKLTKVEHGSFNNCISLERFVCNKSLKSFEITYLNAARSLKISSFIPA